MVRLSALRTGHLYLPRIIRVRGCVDTRAIERSEGFVSMKNSEDTIGNRTRELPVCGAVLQPTAPLHTPMDTILARSNNFAGGRGVYTNACDSAI